MKYSKIKKSSSSSDHYRNISPPCWLALETQTLPQGGRICPLYPPSGDRDADYHHPPHTPRGPKRPNSLNGRLSQTRENFPDKVRKSFFILHPLFIFMATLTKHCHAQSWLETFYTIGTISGLAEKFPNLPVPFESF